jgi:hypothetical protein
MKQSLSVAAVLAVLLSSLVQARSPQAPWPSDYGRLAAFIGTWTVAGEMSAGNAYGAPAGRYTYTERYRWRPGEILVQMNREGRGPAGALRHEVTLGYFLTTRQYSLIGTDLMTGTSVLGTGTVESESWTFHNMGYLGNGRYFHERCRLNFTSADAYTVRCDSGPDGRTWSPSFEGQATR